MLKTIPYIPFERLSAGILERAAEEGLVYWVVQRFNWPGISPGKAFIATPYGEEPLAREHEAQLGPKEGKMLNIKADREKIQKLQQEQTEYKLFSNSFADKDWNKKMMTSYGPKIRNYVKFVSPLRVRGSMQLDIFFTLEYGRLMAIISCENRTDKVAVTDMIK